MYAENGILLGTGYSGAGDGKNNPATQSMKNVGPIPVGLYRIGSPVDTVTHGPHVLPLTPNPQNSMFGRDGFLIHGDSVVAPGTASEGCIILSRAVRDAISASRDRDLQVVDLRI